LTPLYSRKPVIAVIYQVAKDIFRRELGAVPGFVAVKSEHLIYRAYTSHQIITCSPSTRNDLIENGIPSKNIHIVRPGIDEGFLKFQPVARKFADPTIVCISRFRRYKGLSYAVRAMEYVLDKIPTARLIIAGNGDERELKHEISRTRYSGSIQILKRAPNQWNDEKRLLLSRSHLLLIPSVREGYGIVVIEANACGTPAIGWAVPGVQDSIVDGKTGLLVPFEDTQALAQTIVRFLSKESTHIAEMSGAAIDWASQHSWDKAAKGFAETIDSLA
jgi:glycosyltransferase involved in cell wall biosynthesis